jgi:hypothetical protein
MCSAASTSEGMMAEVENPSEKLATLVTRLYRMAGNSKLPPEARARALVLANELRGDLVSLIAHQFDGETPHYDDAIQELTDVNEALGDAADDVAKVVKVIDQIGDVAKVLDALLQAVAAVATK